MQEKIDAFLKANCTIMDGHEAADITYADIPCEVSTIQRSYVALIESELEPFLHENGLSNQEFYEKVERCQEVSKDAACGFSSSSSSYPSPLASRTLLLLLARLTIIFC